MATEIKVPSVGESISSGVLGKWKKNTGDYVRSGEVILEVETDKVTFEVTAEYAGLLTTLAKEGDTVDIGQVVASIDTDAPAPESIAGAPAPAPSATAPTPAQAEAKKPVETFALSPAARYAAAETGVDVTQVPGTGKGGRVTKGDIRAFGSGAVSASEPPKARTTLRPLSPIRRKIADRLVSAQQEAAILTTFNEVDMTQVMALRAKFGERFLKSHNIKLGFMSFFVMAVVHALKRVPGVNAQIDLEAGQIIQNHFYDIGVAVSTEKGLVVPVIRDADKLDFAGVEKALLAYAEKARSGKLTLPDLEGGVFTITNGGVFGSLLSTPILNSPQSGILGMHAIQDRPVAIQGRVEIRPMMYLAHSYDHRLVDGKEAVTFLVAVKEFIENPAVAMLGC